MARTARGSRSNAQTLVERQVRHWDRIGAVLKPKLKEEKSLAEASRRPVLTVSGPTGSGAGEFAENLAQNLGYTLYGREILDAVAEDLHCQRLLLDSLDEKVRSSIMLMFEGWIRGREIEQREYIGALFRVMNSLAEKGGAVILGRGGTFILGEKAGLRIRVDAPLPVRIHHVMAIRKADPEETRQFVTKRDREQAEFCRHYFRHDVAAPLHYDLTINGERFDPPQMVELARAALAERGIRIDRKMGEVA
ncbi:MAG: cytidylate kinase-like family protein [Candidatus Sumerlaeota bacterium]|nr:cytidylate kinase-like family protein [Candidatus Sumerlaeota bacterium]